MYVLIKSVYLLYYVHELSCLISGKIFHINSACKYVILCAFHMQVSMGIYLSSPKTEKASEDGENDRLRYGLSSMQGWRSTMEDAVSAFMCAFSQSFVILKFPSLFAARWTFYAFEKLKLSSLFSHHVLPLSCT